MALPYPCLLLLCYLLGADAAAAVAVFTLQNRCRETIWPGILANAGKPHLMDGGIELRPGQAIDIQAPDGWSGRIWGRNGCTFDQSGKGTCITGDCGGMLKCAGAGGVPPATLAEFTLNNPLDFYDLSLVDGYNMPVSITPSGGNSQCTTTRCASDLKLHCPTSLQVTRNRQVVACKSACLAFNDPQYCCTGAYGSPQTCRPTYYSKLFKTSCPMAYTYAYDDPSSLFTCKGANYAITFC